MGRTRWFGFSRWNKPAC
uniref:Uncharacterized protein MANES_07G086800 n=1 Tax=Rhizophora mucronata TaxID=61149 RepID=A0A2P2JHL0_RHIMU